MFSITSCREEPAVILLPLSSYWKDCTGCQGPTFSHILCLCTDIVDNHKAECRTFYDELSSLINDIPLRDHILICGDFNAPLTVDGRQLKNVCGKPHSNSEAQQALINLRCKRFHATKNESSCRPSTAIGVDARA